MSARVCHWSLVVVLVATTGLARAEEPTDDPAALATSQEETAEALTRRGDPSAARAWARAARLRARAKDRARALADIDRALELVSDDRERTDQAFWRLYLRHGLLDEDGAPSLGRHWPGDAFVEELHATLGGLQGNRETGLWLLALASRAVTANHPEVALDLYLLALRDPVLIDRAREDASIWGGLLVAFPTALKLERLDEAERILDTVAVIANVPRKEMDGYRLALARAREEAARPPPEPEPDPGAAPDAADTPPSPHRGRLLPHGTDPGEEEDQAGRALDDGAEETASFSRRSWLLATVAAAVALLLLATVVRSRRRRTSLGGHPTRR